MKCSNNNTSQRFYPKKCPLSRNCDNTGTLIINLENQTITTNQTHTACSINVKNVIVSNSSKLILDAENEFNIIDEFEVQLGSELEIR